MDGQYSWKRTEETEIYLADLLRSLLKKWKQIAVCALVFAVTAGVYSYVKDRGSAMVSNSGGNMTEEAELTEEERQSVMSAVELQAEVQGMEEYLNDSILMQTDPYHRHKVFLLYSIDQADWQTVHKIAESYLSYILNGGAADALRESDSREWSIDKSYLAELILAYQKTYDSVYQAAAESAVPAEALFYVEITGRDEEMALRLADDLQAVLKRHCSKVRDRAGSHELRLLCIQENTVSDSGLLAQQRDKKAQLAANQSSLKTMTDAFNDMQMEMYRKEAVFEEEEMASSAADKSEGAEADAGSEDDGADRRGIFIKYIFIGLIAGIFVYCGIYVCRYLFRDTVKSEEEIKNLYTLPFYGTQAASDGQADKYILNRIRLACKKDGITNLCMASDLSFHSQEKQCMENLKEQIKGCGIHAVIVENAEKDAAMWDTLAETGHVLMVWRIGTTTHGMIDDAMRFYQENGVSVLGVMAFSKEK